MNGDENIVPPKEERGWWYPSNSKKAHYMVNNRSLCGKMGAFGRIVVDDTGDASPDNCAECKRRLATISAPVP